MLRLLLMAQILIGISSLKADNLPRIRMHSAQIVTVYQGDRVSLEIVPSSEVKEIQWWIGKKKVCDTAKCQIQTSDLSPGTYQVMAIMVNDYGSQFMNFQVKVKELLDNRQPKDIAPELITKDYEDTPFDHGKPYIVAIKGTGFAWRLDKLQFIREGRRNLDWNEKLKSSGSILNFGTAGHDEYFLLPGSQARLINHQDKRLVMLQSGRLRFRSRNGQQEASQSIIVGDWLQVDASSSSDFAIDYNPEKDLVDLYVFSGQLRFIKQSEKKIVTPASIDYISAGVKIKLEKKRPAHRTYKVIPLKDVAYIFKNTTPELLLEQSIADPKKTTFVGPDYRNPLRTAEQLIAEKKYSIALEVLNTAAEILRKSPQWHQLAGQALGELNLARESLRLLKPLFEKNHSARTALQIGLRYFENRNWKKAKQWLEKSLELDELPMRHISLYYLGVIAFRDEDYPVADRYFRETEWYADSIELIESSKGFLDLISFYNDWGVNLKTLVRIDSNIFRTANKSNLAFQSDISGLSGMGYDAGFLAWWYLFHSRFSSLHFGYDVRRIGWLKESLSAVTFVDQELFSAFSFGKEVYLEGKLALATKIVGKDRALDGLVLETQLGWKAVVMQPEIDLHLGVYKDPLPGKNDLLDPLSFELQQSPSDRSSRLINSTINLSLWKAPRQKVLGSILYGSRTYSNSLMTTENYSLVGLGAKYQLRFWGLSRVFASMNHSTRSFRESAENRVDTLHKVHGGYSFDMEHDGNFNLNISYENQKSTIDEHNYHRFVISTGIEILI